MGWYRARMCLLNIVLVSVDDPRPKLTCYVTLPLAAAACCCRLILLSSLRRARICLRHRKSVSALSPLWDIRCYHLCWPSAITRRSFYVPCFYVPYYVLSLLRAKKGLLKPFYARVIQLRNVLLRIVK